MAGNTVVNVAAFGYYLNSMLKQLSSIFPECLVTKTISEGISSALENNEMDSLESTVVQWKAFMDTEEMNKALENEDLNTILGAKIPIFDLMHVREKVSDPRITPNSRQALMRFVRKLQEIALPDRVLGSPSIQYIDRETSIVQSNLASPTNIRTNDILQQLPPEMTPLIDLARSFIQKMPEEDVKQMFGNITSIGQTVMRNYEGVVPEEIGGDYFSKILKETFQ